MKKCLCDLSLPTKKDDMNYICISIYNNKIPRIYLGTNQQEGRFLFAAYGDGPNDISSNHIKLNYCPICGRDLKSLPAFD